MASTRSNMIALILPSAGGLLQLLEIVKEHKLDGQMPDALTEVISSRSGADQ